jgi:high affinity Mn2+ porin
VSRDCHRRWNGHRRWVHLAAISAFCLSFRAAADSETYAIHGQFTYVEQETSDFDSPYQGTNSLSPGKGAETVDATLYLGARPWRNAEMWINPELDQGHGLDDTLGAAGFPSGEAYKVGRNQPYLRLQRVFLRQTLDLGADRIPVAAAANQLGGESSENRVVIWLGKFGVTDVFDTNRYAHDPRVDFLNWTAIDTGTFDYAADAWGYSAGGAVEWYENSWTLRAGLFDLSNVPNSPHLDPGFHEYQGVAELEHRHRIGELDGRILLTLFDSRGRMGLLDTALAQAQLAHTVPDIAAVREYRSRLGAGIGFEQALSRNVGLFGRIGKAAGNVEAYEFTDVDRSWVLGTHLAGDGWHRSDDSAGFAVVANNASAARQRYLAAGGLGILVGDGRLPRAAAEQIFETYYSAALLKLLQVSFDYQWIGHPAYNAERGPVSVIAIRLHGQF